MNTQTTSQILSVIPGVLTGKELKAATLIFAEHVVKRPIPLNLTPGPMLGITIQMMKPKDALKSVLSAAQAETARLIIRSIYPEITHRIVLFVLIVIMYLPSRFTRLMMA
jgi:hypothetical protein